MDGVHDLGGREGFGPIRDKDDAVPFHAEWETRAFGMEQSSASGAGWSIDWFRHCRELIVPTDYLTRPYFDQWATTLAAQMIDEGYLTLEEVKAGAATFIPQPGYPPGTAGSIPSFCREPEKLRSERRLAPALRSWRRRPLRSWRRVHGHTRMPGYVRGRAGVIHAHHGGHVLPDASARGEKRAEHLYTVSFSAAELWAEAETAEDHVFVDLWESYLEPA